MKSLSLLAALAAATFIALPSAAAEAADKACKAPVEGLAPLMTRPGLRYLLVGEIHGTVETPALFSDIACAASSRPLIVGVEWPADSQASLDAFIAATDAASATRLLHAAPALQRPDGRGSRAMIAMMMDMWRLKRAGRDISFVAFDHEIATPGTSNERETRMAALLAAASRKRPDALVVALTGLGHADKTGFTSFNPPFPAMIQHFPEAETASIAMAVHGGQVWACRRPVPAEPLRCGAVDIPSRTPARPRGMDVGSPGFDASLSTGGAYTASPSGPEAHRQAETVSAAQRDIVGAAAASIGVGAAMGAGARAMRVSKCRCGASR